MPPLPLLPNRPAGQPDYYPASGGYGSSPASGGSYQYDGMTVPRATPEDPYAEVRWWRMHEADVTDRALKEQNAFNKQQLENQRIDAAAALKNAMEIAKLTDQTSRYGTDVASRDRLAALEVNQQQFRANHALDQRKFGLDYAKAYTDFASTPDRMFMMNDFTDAMGRIGQGYGPQPYGAQGQPQAKDWNDFAVLQGFGNIPGVQASGGGAQSGGGGQGASSGGGADPRVKAVRGIMDASPPSDGYGHDDNNFAALAAIENVFRMSKPGSYDRMRPGQQKAFAGGLNRLGYYAPDAIADMRRNDPGQGRANSY